MLQCQKMGSKQKNYPDHVCGGQVFPNTRTNASSTQIIIRKISSHSLPPDQRPSARLRANEPDPRRRLCLRLRLRLFLLLSSSVSFTGGQLEAKLAYQLPEYE